MKRVLSVIIIITILAVSFIGFSGTVLAANETLEVKTAVKELVEGGPVNFTATITAGDTTLVGYKITCNGSTVYNSDGATLAVNTSSNEVAFSMQVTTAMLGTPIVFTLAADSGSNLGTDSVTIAKKEPTILLAVSGVPNRTLAAKGDIITFTFSFENQGDVKIDDIVITAPELNKGKALRDGFSLSSKQSYNVVYKHTMDKAIIVNPVVNYKYNGVAQTPIKLSPIELKLEERKVVTTLTVNNSKPNAGEEVTFTYTISNEGNVPYTNLKVYINGEEVSFPAKNLNPGNEYSEEYVRSFTVSTDVIFSATLKDHFGQTVSAGDEKLTMKLPVDPEELNSKLSFNMSVDRPRLTGNSTINFTGNITNSSEYILSDVRIDEVTLGSVFSADEILPASGKRIEFSSNIEKTTTYNFVLTVIDRDGREYTVNAEPITVTVESVAIEDEDEFEDAADVSAPGQELTLEKNEHDGLGTLGVIIIILIVLTLGVGTAIVVLWRRGAGNPTRGSKPARTAGISRAPSSGRKPVKKPVRSYRDRNNF